MNKNILPGVIVLISFAGGIVLAFIEERLYNDGVVIDEFIAGSITISELMALTVVIFVLFGIVVAAIKS